MAEADGATDVAVDASALAEAVGGSVASEGLPPTRVGGNGWIEIKRFGKNKQRAYRYIRWREGKVKRSLYDGKVLF